MVISPIHYIAYHTHYPRDYIFTCSVSDWFFNSSCKVCFSLFNADISSFSLFISRWSASLVLLPPLNNSSYNHMYKHNNYDIDAQLASSYQFTCKATSCHIYHAHACTSVVMTANTKLCTLELAILQESSSSSITVTHSLFWKHNMNTAIWLSKSIPLGHKTS